MRVFFRLLAIAVTLGGGPLAAPHGFAQTAPQRQPDIAGLAQDRLARLACLFRLEFADPADAAPEAAGRPVHLGLAFREDHTLKMKPQNLLVNLPLRRGN